MGAATLSTAQTVLNNAQVVVIVERMTIFPAAHSPWLFITSYFFYLQFRKDARNHTDTLLSRKITPSTNERSKMTRVGSRSIGFPRENSACKLPTRSGTLALSGSASVALL